MRKSDRIEMLERNFSLFENWHKYETEQNMVNQRALLDLAKFMFIGESASCFSGNNKVVFKIEEIHVVKEGLMLCGSDENQEYTELLSKCKLCK